MKMLAAILIQYNFHSFLSFSMNIFLKFLNSIFCLLIRFTNFHVQYILSGAPCLCSSLGWSLLSSSYNRPLKIACGKLQSYFQANYNLCGTPILGYRVTSSDNISGGVILTLLRSVPYESGMLATCCMKYTN